jgi:hypothetical protein
MARLALTPEILLYFLYEPPGRNLWVFRFISFLLFLLWLSLPFRRVRTRWRRPLDLFVRSIARFYKKDQRAPNRGSRSRPLQGIGRMYP